MVNEALTNIALLYSMAAIGGSGDGDGTNNSSYDYAVKAGFKGSEAKFQELWLASLNSGFTNMILDGGESDSQVHTVQNDGGLSSTTKYDILISGNNELDELNE